MLTFSEFTTSPTLPMSKWSNVCVLDSKFMIPDTTGFTGVIQDRGVKVVESRLWQKMVGVNAKSVPTCDASIAKPQLSIVIMTYMANIHAIRDWAFKKFPRESMCEYLFNMSHYNKFAITGIHRFTKPHPMWRLYVFVNLLKESVRNGTRFSSHKLDYSLSDLIESGKE